MNTPHLFPTPTANRYGTTNNGQRGDGTAYKTAGTMSLHSMALHNTWPTPTRNDFKNAGWQRMDRKQYFTLPGAAGATTHLPEELETQREQRWPTPTTQDAENNGGPSPLNQNSLPRNAVVSGQLNPNWVEWLMGWPPGWSDPTLSCFESFVDWTRHQDDWFDDDPAHTNVPRIAKDVRNRPARLKAIGNGQVPACVVLAWDVLLEMQRQMP